VLDSSFAGGGTMPDEGLHWPSLTLRVGQLALSR